MTTMLTGLTGIYYNSNAEKREKMRNNISTAAGTGAVLATGYGVRKFLQSNPEKAVKLYEAADKYIGAGLEKTFEGFSWVSNQLKKTKIGKKAVDSLYKGIQKVAKTNTGKKVVKKILSFMDKADKMGAAKRGKYALVAAGLTLAAGLIISMVRNHDKKEGAIEQKYKDINAFASIV